MKKLIKRIFILNFLILFLFPAWSFAKEIPKPNENYYIDELNILSDNTKKLINKTNNTFTDGQQFFVLTVKDLDKDPVEYGVRAFNIYKLGSKDKNNGLLMLLAENKDGSHRIQVITGYGLEEILPDGKVGRIIDNIMLKDFKNNKLDIGVRKGFIAFSDILNNGSKSKYNKYGKMSFKEKSLIMIIVSLFTFAFINLIIYIYEQIMISKYTKKFSKMNEWQLRDIYPITDKKCYLKPILMSELQNKMQQEPNKYTAKELLEKYKNESIENLDIAYYNILKQIIIADPISEKDIRYYTQFIWHNKIRDLLAEKLISLNPQKFAILNDCELFVKINKLKYNDIDRTIYVNELTNRIKNRKYSEKELINLASATSDYWLKDIFLDELQKHIQSNDIYTLDKTLVSLTDEYILDIYENTLKDKLLQLNDNDLHKFSTKSKYSRSLNLIDDVKSIHYSSNSSFSGGGGSTGGGGTGRSF